jgi:hypothetical protein
MKRGILLAAFATTADAAVIPLNAVTSMGGPRLTVTASPTAADGSSQPPQQLLLDTGSSTLSFCDSSLADKVKSLQSKYYSCNIYGNAVVKEGYYGPFYEGVVQVNKGTIKVPNAYYSIMKQEIKMPCQDGINGIFGVAFKALDQATDTPPAGWSSGTVGTCTKPSADLVQPLMQYLNTKGGVEKLGIYWSGKQGDGEGQLYLDDDATSNDHYNEAQASAIGKAALGFKAWYDINVQSVDFNGKSFTDITCDPFKNSPCIMDTGTPVLVIPQDAYQAISESKSGELSVKLQGAGSTGTKPVELKFDVKTLLDNQWVEPSPTPNGGVTLGLPLRAFYYSVVDITDSTIEFVPTKAFATTVVV